MTESDEIHERDERSSGQISQTVNHDSGNTQFNDFFQDTQIIPQEASLLNDDSQPSRLKRLRMLGSNEENKIVDSSYDDNSIDTQMISQRKSTVPINDNERLSLIDDSKVQIELDKSGIDTSDVATSSDDKKRDDPFAPSSAFNDVKFPGSNTPHINKLRDTESATPWLNKIIDPFKDTPINNKILDRYNKTPNSNLKGSKSFSTPISAPHNIFEKLRENQSRPELEVDTQSLPSLAFESPSQNLTHTPTQTQLKTQPHDSQEKSTIVKIHRIEETVVNDTLNDTSIQSIDDTVNDQVSDVPIVQEAFTNDQDDDGERLTHVDTSFLPNDTLKLDETQTKNSAINKSRIIEASQGDPDLQVLGTAPDNNNSLSFNFNEDDTDIRDDKSLSVISDDENTRSSIDANMKASSYLLAEDSIPKYHRDLQVKKVSPEQETNHFDYSKSFPIISESSPEKSRANPPELRMNSFPSANNDVTNRRLQGLLHEAQLPKPQNDTSNLETIKISSTLRSQPVDTEDISLVENITQDLSDVDASKVENTIDEENAYRFRDENDDNNNDEDDDETDDSSLKLVTGTLKRRRPSTKKGNVISSSKSDKRSKHQEHQAETSSSLTPQNTSDDLHPTSKLVEPSNGFISSHNCTSEPSPEILRKETRKLQQDDVVSKNSVWCLYNEKFYPGIAQGHGKKGILVKFVDVVDEVSVIYPLDIQIGDKVNIGRTRYLITGLQALVEREEFDDTIRCMRGYDTIFVKKFKGKGKKKTPPEEEEIFPLSSITIDNDEWYKRNRFGADIEAKPKRLLLKEPHGALNFQEELLISTPQKQDLTLNIEGSVFEGCLFVITGEVDKDKLTEIIQKNGGTVVEEGFSSLITLKESNGQAVIKPNPTLSQYQFAAVITKRHVRSPKYLEALALGWPLLSDLFIYHCVSQVRLLDNITNYLLPAGESKQLSSTKSADVTQFVSNWKSDLNLSDQLKNNKVLKNRYVFLISSNPEIAKFVFYVLGAKFVKALSLTNYSNLVNQLSTARDEIGDVLGNDVSSSTFLIYHEKLNTLESLILNLEQQKTNLPRKSQRSKAIRTTQRRSPMITDILIEDGAGIKIELIDWEWIVQCIIDGFPGPGSITKILNSDK